MPNVNLFIGTGHLGRDPELRSTQSGVEICNFSVGITSSEKVNGNWEKHTEWVRAVVFGNQAKWLSEAQKGDLVCFRGRLKTRKWTDKDGTEKYSTEVICDDAQAVKRDKSTQVNNVQDDSLSDDIPF